MAVWTSAFAADEPGPNWRQLTTPVLSFAPSGFYVNYQSSPGHQPTDNNKNVISGSNIK